MSRIVCFWVLAVTTAGLVTAADRDPDIVFRSDVSLVRVDAQVVDRGNRAVTGLRADDFVVLEEGKPQPIRNFTRENMPVDVLLLFDVSASMRPHVERIISAAHEAFRVLGSNDRVAVMVFDRSTRLRLPFRTSRQDVEHELDSLLRQETFDGGTDITRALVDAARYIGREGRKDARRAIVILTDDQTERERDEARVSRALVSADAVLSALIAPDAMRSGPRGMGRGRGGGGTWPGGTSGGIGGPLGGIIFGRRGPYGGRGPGSGGPGSGGPVVFGPHTQSAGTSEIAQQSGGDSMSVDDASALQTTLERIRQRYALHFYLPAGVKPGEERAIDVQLTSATRSRYPDAEVKFRRVYLAPGGPADPAGTVSEPVEVTRGPDLKRRRPAVNESSGPRIDTTTPASQDGGWPRTDQPAAPPATSGADPAPASTNTGTTDQSSGQGGWRRVKPGEQP
jgi:VWFA-related protein